jgi:hypothetical protein
MLSKIVVKTALGRGQPSAILTFEMNIQVSWPSRQKKTVELAKNVFFYFWQFIVQSGVKRIETNSRRQKKN